MISSFQAPFAQWRVYESMITQDNQTVSVSFDLTIP
jgi:hypothetical protein